MPREPATGAAWLKQQLFFFEFETIIFKLETISASE